MKVKATQKGYYGKFRVPGDEFTLKDGKHFSKKWMVALDAPKAEKPDEPKKDETSVSPSEPKAKAKSTPS